MTQSFLQRKPLPEARALLVAGVRPVDAERISASDASGRIAAEDVVARHPAPHYRASAMDGVAVRSADTAAASASPVLMPVVAADGPGDDTGCLPVDTGSVLPDWADAVVRIEDTTLVTSEPADRSCYRISSPVAPRRDVRRIGEDIGGGVIVVRAGQRIGAWDIGAMLATGTTDVSVRKRPRIAIVSTGSEVVEPDGHAGAGQIIDYNSRMIAALAEEWGASAHRLGIVADDEKRLSDAVADAASRFDAVCVIAGSSAGRKDLTTSVLASLGEMLVHGVDIAPGRPVAIARIAKGDARATAVLAIPGYPVAAVVVCERLLRPLVAALLGSAEPMRPLVRARVVRNIPSRLGVDEFRRVVVTRQAGGLDVVAPLPSGAGSISTVSTAHGWLAIAATVEGIDAGSDVEIELLAAPGEIDAAFVLAGQPCAASAALESALRRQDLRARVHHLRLSAHDGLDAVARGEAHAAIVAQDASAGTDTGLPPSLRLQTGDGIGAAFAVVTGSTGDERLARLIRAHR